MLRAVGTPELRTLRIFKFKSKEGQVERVQDERTVICKGLFKPVSGARPHGWHALRRPHG